MLVCFCFSSLRSKAPFFDVFKTTFWSVARPASINDSVASIVVFSSNPLPPGIWFGFQGLAFGSSLLMNVADVEHDPNEVLRKVATEFAFDWSVK